MRAVIIIVIAYFLGSIPFGYLIVRATTKADVRETGSGGTGATNVSRRAGKLAGVLTLLLDAFKGAAAVAIARVLVAVPFSGVHGGEPVAAWWVAVAGIVVIIGHCFPVWLNFRGGKGVATGIGVFVVLTPPLAVVGAALIFILIVWLSRYVSLGSIVASATLPLIILVVHFFIKPVPEFQSVMLVAIVGCLLIIFMHRANIGRLLQGTENKFK
jgi:glycerol-3-phosphate acyltransferase PlsY